MKPRCIMTTISIDKGVKHPNTEPLATLQHSVVMKRVMSIFGQNVIIRQTVLYVGEILLNISYKKQYLITAPVETQSAPIIENTQTVRLNLMEVFKGNKYRSVRAA